MLSGAGLIVTVTYGAYDIVETQNLSVGMLMAFLSYRGYFSEEAARKLEGDLNDEGFDVAVGGYL